MKIYPLIKTVLTHPYYVASYYRKLIHAFDFFNIDYHLFGGYSFPPKSICFILTEKCNLQCKMCDIGRRNVPASNEIYSPLVQSIRSGNEDMSTGEWLTLIEDLSGFYPHPLVLLTGTEPFLYPDIEKIIEAITANKLSLHITTNGTLLSDYAFRLVEMCQAPYNIEITVSLDDIGEYHDDIRGIGGTFQRAIKGIKKIVQARETKRQTFPSINITCTISNYNYTHLESFVRWFAEERIPIESITFNHLWFKDAHIVEMHHQQCGEEFSVQQENMQYIDITAIDMAIVYQQIQNIKKIYAHAPFRIHQQPDLSAKEAALYYSDPCRFVFYNKCTAPWRNVAITPKGNIILSPLCFFPAIGNVKQETFSMQWNGNRFKNIRARLKKAKAFPACSRCCMLFGSKPKYHTMKSWLA